MECAMDVNPQPVEEYLRERENPPLEKGNPLPEKERRVETRLKNWTKDEIFELLQTIKVFGSKNISRIADNIPTKSVQEIKMAIAYYRERAAHHPNAPPKKKAWSIRKNPRPPVPLSEWAKLLQDTLNFKDLQTETPTALRIIADFDNIPSATQTENVDFRNIYHSIANAMEGKAIPDNPALTALLNACILETAMNSRLTMRSGTLKNVLEYIDMSDKTISVLPRPTENAELATLRHLASQRNYNPLGIAEQNLKPN